MHLALAVLFRPSTHLDFTVDAHFSRKAGGDVGISAAAREFEVNGTIDFEGLVEGTFCAGA
jgi:hypothetical protein